MTLDQLLTVSYQWLDRRAVPVFFAAVLFPALGTALARIGKGGRSDQDGRLIASVIVGIAIGGAVFEVFCLSLAHSILHRSLLQANVLLLAAPLVCLACSLAGMRWVFPLNELASVQTAYDVGAFILACAGAAWIFSKFRGWGIFFVGNLTQLAAYLILGIALLRRLAQRAFGADKSAPSP